MRAGMRDQAVAAAIFSIILTGSAFAQYYPNPTYPGFGMPAHTAWWQNLTTLKIVGEIISAVLGFITGAIFSPLLKPIRRIAFFILLIISVLYSWFDESSTANSLSVIISIFVFFVAFGYGIRLGYKALRQIEEVPTSFGTAKWATENYLREKGLFTDQGFMLGSFVGLERSNVLHYNGARHLLTVAPTRSGKGVSSIIPNLLSYKGSAFVIDPKGENALVTAHRRGTGNPGLGIPGLGQQVFVVDPWNIAARQLGTAPACFNPLDWIKADDPDAVENAFLLADALVPSQGTGDSKFWDEETKALLMGLILFVAIAPSETQHRHLGRIRDILMLDEPRFMQLMKTMAAEPNPVVAATARRTLGKDLKLLSNVLAASQSHTHFLDSPRIRESLSKSNFRFEDLKTGLITIYLILPSDRLETFGRWLRLLIQQAITVNARSIEVKPLRPVLFLLDEMPALGRLTMVEQAYGLMAGFGIQLWGIVQDLSQLERVYDKGWQTFISNSGVIQYFGSRDKMTAEYFSTLCGVTTVKIFSITEAIARAFGTSTSTDGKGGGSSGTNESTTHTHSISSNESQRQLAYPDELMVLHDQQQLVFVENLDPIRATKTQWYTDEHLMRLGVNLQTSSRSQPPPPPPRPHTPLQESEVLRTMKRGDALFTLFKDGSVRMTSPREEKVFASMSELKAYMNETKRPTQ